MTMIQPPAFPAQLLKRLVPARNHDALLGDLCEEYQNRRSRMWYWAQILAAVLVGTGKDVQAHSLLALRAVAVGITSTIVLIPVRLQLLDIATGAGFMWGTTWIGLPRHWHYPYFASWSYRAFVETEFVLATMASGWIVVRSHRHHGVTMAVAFVAGLIAFRLAYLAMVPGPILNVTWRDFAQSWSFEATLILLGGYVATTPLEHS
jgi:hypothetical protein